MPPKKTFEDLKRAKEDEKKQWGDVRNRFKTQLNKDEEERRAKFEAIRKAREDAERERKEEESRRRAEEDLRKRKLEELLFMQTEMVLMAQEETEFLRLRDKAKTKIRLEQREKDTQAELDRLQKEERARQGPARFPNTSVREAKRNAFNLQRGMFFDDADSRQARFQLIRFLVAA